MKPGDLYIIESGMLPICIMHNDANPCDTRKRETIFLHEGDTLLCVSVSEPCGCKTWSWDSDLPALSWCVAVFLTPKGIVFEHYNADEKWTSWQGQVSLKDISQ